MGITKAGNIYGFDQVTYDSHAMKNSEWALISYLTQSQYGKYGNSLYTGANKEVYMNNHNGFMTGCSSGYGSAIESSTCDYRYNNMTILKDGTGYVGAGASTTGNITGIYDTNGGSFEYMMGVLNKVSGTTMERNSGYTGQLADGNTFTGRDWPLEKYYNVYTSGDVFTACNGSPCKGHALDEVIGWYGDFNVLLLPSQSWVDRSGGYYKGAGSGIFANEPWNGFVGTRDEVSFRVVLTPQ